jgi:hypothetical protein
MEEFAFAEGRGPDPATKDSATAIDGFEEDPLRWTLQDNSPVATHAAEGRSALSSGKIGCFEEAGSLSLDSFRAGRDLAMCGCMFGHVVDYDKSVLPAFFVSLRQHRRQLGDGKIS